MQSTLAAWAAKMAFTLLSIVSLGLFAASPAAGASAFTGCVIAALLAASLESHIRAENRLTQILAHLERRDETVERTPVQPTAAPSCPLPAPPRPAAMRRP